MLINYIYTAVTAVYCRLFTQCYVTGRWLPCYTSICYCATAVYLLVSCRLWGSMPWHAGTHVLVSVCYTVTFTSGCDNATVTKWHTSKRSGLGKDIRDFVHYITIWTSWLNVCCVTFKIYLWSTKIKLSVIFGTICCSWILLGAELSVS